MVTVTKTFEELAKPEARLAEIRKILKSIEC